MTLRMWIGLGLSLFTGRRKAECSTRICLFCFLRMWPESEDRSSQKICYAPRDETRLLDLRQWKKISRSEVNLPVFLTKKNVLWVDREYQLDLGAELKQKSGVWGLRSEYLCGLLLVK